MASGTDNAESIDDRHTVSVPPPIPSHHADTTTRDDDDGEAADQVLELPAAGDVDQLAPPLPPDGGWGWAVVAAAFTTHVIIDGLCYTFGIIMPELLQHFKAGKGKTALVGSMLPGCYLLVGKPYLCELKGL